MDVMSNPDLSEQLREEFNRWAAAGRGEGMEEDHLPITLPVLDLMQLSSDDNVFDVGCGAGWLERLLSERVSGDIVQSAGPWRTSGDWWTDTAWNRDEWDVVLEDRAVYRVYLSAKQWFLGGSYD